MKLIGLTGNIGCGKSTVAGMLRARGVPSIDADDLARQVRQTDGDARAAILARFGTLDPGGLAQRVFGDVAELRALEAIVHPRVRDLARARLAELAEGGATAAVVEAIKLMESPLHDQCDQVWVVRCTEEDRRRRLAERGISEDDARARLASQAPQDALIGVADVVIDGSAPREQTEGQVAAALAGLLG